MISGLEGKVALVTGASSGIGRASALAFAREGVKVVVADIDVEGGGETVRLIKNDGGEAMFVKADVSQSAEVTAMANKIIQNFGRLDCAHNNAGIEPAGQLVADLSEEDWDKHIRVNLKSVWLCMKYEIPLMLKLGKGAIVNTSSMAGLRGRERLADYCSAKHGVVGLTRAAALDYAREGIRVNAVCPGPVRTALVERYFAQSPENEARVAGSVPLGRMGTTAEIAEVVVWLCSDAASFITGHALSVDGGTTVK